MKIDVLDHGYCRMTSYTQPVPFPTQQDDDTPFVAEAMALMDEAARSKWTGDLEIVRAARTSYNADWRARVDAKEGPVLESKDAKLIHRLWKDGHTSPFEAMSFTFEVQAPLFVFRQWHRHRTQSYSEVSARYTEMPDLFYIPKPESIGHQDPKNKQGRDLDNVVQEWAEDKAQYIRSASKLSYDNYKYLLAAGVSRELARMVLPVNIYSRMYASANLLNWFRFLKLRLDPHAQYEIRVYAEAILEHLKKVCPISVAAFQTGMPALGTEFNPQKLEVQP